LSFSQIIRERKSTFIFFNYMFSLTLKVLKFRLVIDSAKTLLVVEAKFLIDVLKITTVFDYIFIKLWSYYDLTSVFECFKHDRIQVICLSLIIQINLKVRISRTIQECFSDWVHNTNKHLINESTNHKTKMHFIMD
jgi:hypothetical protein